MTRGVAIEDAHDPKSAEYKRVSSEELMQRTDRLLAHVRAVGERDFRELSGR